MRTVFLRYITQSFEIFMANILEHCRYLNTWVYDYLHFLRILKGTPLPLYLNWMMTDGILTWTKIILGH